MKKRARKKIERLARLLREQEILEAKLRLAKEKGVTDLIEEDVGKFVPQPPAQSPQTPQQKYKGYSYQELLVMEADGALVGEDLNWFRSKSGPSFPGQVKMPKL